MTTPMIHQVAQHMWFDFCDQQGWPNGLPTWDEMAAFPEGDRNNRCAEFLSLARAALEELREPTPEMLAAGSCGGDVPYADDVWQAMINTALGERSRGMNMMTRRTTHPNPEPVPGYLADLRIEGASNGAIIRGTIYRALFRAAQRAQPCPSAEVLADLCGLSSVSTTVYHMRVLERRKLITCASYQRGRVVTIVASGDQTRPVVGEKARPHWRGGPQRVDSNYARNVRKGRG